MFLFTTGPGRSARSTARAVAFAGVAGAWEWPVDEATNSTKPRPAPASDSFFIVGRTLTDRRSGRDRGQDGAPRTVRASPRPVPRRRASTPHSGRVIWMATSD